MAGAAPKLTLLNIVLQPNLDDDPEEAQDLLYPPEPGDASHLEFLRNNPNGFLRVARLHPRNQKITLVQSRGAGPPQLYIAKLCNGFDYCEEPNSEIAREVRICTLANDPNVERTLPIGAQFVETLAYQRLEREAYANLQASQRNLTAVYLRFYNGGALNELAERYRLADEAVPETFIWHAMEQICRGLRYLHLGISSGSRRSTAQAPRNWDPIYLRDMNESNIWLHFPGPSDRVINDNSNTFDNSFPQIILGDFGFIMTASDITSGSGSYPSELQCLSGDISALGIALRLLCFVQGYDCPVDGGDVPSFAHRNVEELRGRYSNLLIDVLKRWGPMIEAYGADPMASMWEVPEEHLDGFPDGWPDLEWLYDQALPTAAQQVAQAKATGTAPAILRGALLDQDQRDSVTNELLPTGMRPRTFYSMEEANNVMNGYMLRWTTVPVIPESEAYVEDEPGDLRFHLRIRSRPDAGTD
ncbi:unnamed protein product [Discula destructiva]